MQSSEDLAPTHLRSWLVSDGARQDDTSFAVHDPRTGDVVAHVADSSVAEAVAAVDMAALALPGWATSAPRLRSDILGRAYELMIDRVGELAQVIQLENGKSAADAEAEVRYAAEYLRWFAHESVRPQGHYGLNPDGASRALISRKPIGVVALVTPWNFPAAMITRKVAPAIAAGCTAVLKPAAETPLTARALLEILNEAGLPEGVVTLVPTSDPGPVVGAWLADSRVRKLSFTGSTRIGRLLLRQASERVVKTSMELGGNAPFIVMPDADINAAVAGALTAKFRNSGQACTAADRFYLHRSVAEEFTQRFAAAVARQTVAPLISPQSVRRMDALVEEAVDLGAEIRATGPIPHAGWHYPATLLTDCRPEMQVVSEETFGPIAAVSRWDDEEELIAEVNQAEVGLASYLYTSRLQDALRLAERIDAGMVAVNRGLVSEPSAPFGGVKQSGIGREGGREGISDYQEIQFLNVDLDH